MSLHQRRPHLVCYDIADPRRLGRVHRYLKKIGVPLQYSVFLLHIDSGQVRRIQAGLTRIIDPRRDDIRIYPLPLRPDWQYWGQPLWPEGFFPEGMPLPQKKAMVK